MKNSFICIISFFIIVISISCQKEVEIDIPQVTPKLVVTSFFCSDSVFRVQVAASTYVSDTNYIYINNAIVELYENIPLPISLTGKKTDQLLQLDIASSGGILDMALGVEVPLLQETARYGENT